MKDYEAYKGPNGDDEHWERVYEAPQINMGVSTAKSIDAWDNNSFVNRTKDMKGTVGDLLDHYESLTVAERLIVLIPSPSLASFEDFVNAITSGNLRPLLGRPPCLYSSVRPIR